MSTDHPQSTPPAGATDRTISPAVENLPGHAQVLGSLSEWKELIRDEERRCEELGLGAAILSILARRGQHDLDDDGVQTVLRGSLRVTDRTCLLRAGEHGVLLIPLDGPRAAEVEAQRIYDDLQSAGHKIAMGWAMRRAGHGLFHAAAQADAAVLRGGTGHIDLTEG